ncbi:uncharacterized protein B0P05DRAFT_599327 [Gilbertella persicaria]|uniref:uncharacterized protein n=1 Tax=Gilbertella persicaria TaxID=101096 RepID=UPI00221F7F40|nr:uncharacterized protein B0P05DRAFT_599327 [Gilbertella persicaria]KAI8062775.1 hypothetical protein B0P05DRAFT_599327 [Gilbertella persicaria]
MVYDDLFDYIFASKEGYMTKRSECHSRIIKSLKGLGLIKEDEPNVRLDFIFCNTSVTGTNDVLICEDKPTGKESTKDTKKPTEKNQHFSLTSCCFNKLKLIITTTKIIDNTIVHTILREVSMSASEKSVRAIADFISVIISLMRTIVKNIDTIETILQVIHEDNLNFMTPDDSFIHDSDSDSSTASTISTPKIQEKIGKPPKEKKELRKV